MYGRSEGAQRIFKWFGVIAVVLALFYVTIFAVDMSPRTRGVVAVTGFLLVSVPWLVLVVLTAARATAGENDSSNR